MKEIYVNIGEEMRKMHVLEIDWQPTKEQVLSALGNDIIYTKPGVEI